MTSLPGRKPDLLLEADLTTAPLELTPDDPIGRIRTRHRTRLRPLLRALYEAGEDRRVRGLIVKVGSGIDWALGQELRDGLLAFARSGKPVVAWAETLGDGRNGSSDYLLATGAGEIWLQPTGELGLQGVASETTFLRGTLDKLGIEPELDKRYEYKSAADRLMNTEFTEPHREAVDAVIGSVWDGAVAAIARARGVSEARVRELADTAPLDAATAQDAGLIDRVGYRDEAYAALRDRLGDPQLLFADQWSPRRTVRSVVRRDKDFVALVDAHGEIHTGRSAGGARGQRMGSDSVSAALRAARRNDHARAVLLRVDSPGGSAVASDAIWREVVLTRDAGKPVIVSMGAVAGSGGYYIACAADRIVAQPATITGSIGVIGGKVVITDLLERLGVTTGAVEHGAAARMYSPRRTFTAAERDSLAATLDRVYRDFVQKVADGRHLDYEAVHAVAKGRIWSGADARDRGLVDDLGGQRQAAAIARERGGLRADAAVRPALHVSPLARLGRARSSDDPRALAVVASPWGELGAIAAALGLPASGPLAMPALRLR